MSIFTARENFKTEFIAGGRVCANCKKSIHGKNALVCRWSNRKRRDNSLVVCNEECWSTYDHNFWLKRRGEKEINDGNHREAERLLDSCLPTY